MTTTEITFACSIIYLIILKGKGKAQNQTYEPFRYGHLKAQALHFYDGVSFLGLEMKWRQSCHMPKSRISVLNLASSILSWWERRILMLQLLLNLYCHVEMNLKSVKIVFLWNQGKLLGNENIFGPILFYEVATHCLHPWFLEWEWLSSVDLLTPREKSFSILKKQLPLLILLNATRKVYKAVKVHLSYELKRNPVTFNISKLYKTAQT